MKKKVGIITILKVNNYGAELQSYALQRKLNLMGYDAEIIDYLYYKHPKHKREALSKPFYHYSLKNKIKEFALAIKNRLLRMRDTSAYSIREKKFEDFHTTYNQLSSTCYTRMSQLYNNPPEYDIYCVGSDQVWNPRCYTNIEPYFLTFAPRNAKRISYASSFGTSTIPNSAINKYKELILGLDNIGVRESSGEKLINSLTGRSAKVVLDPTLLLTDSQWRAVEKPVKNVEGKYVLVYELQHLTNIMQIAKDTAKKNNWGIVRVCKDVFDKRIEDNVINITDAGPSEFVWLIDHASFIVTNSFHGTAFSVNFNKPFYCVLRRGKGNNSRQVDFLKACGLLGRVNYDGERLPDTQSVSIAFNEVNEQLDKMRLESCDYLSKSIEDGK